MQNPTMKIQEVTRYVGLCRTSIYMRVKAGTFPAPRKLGPRINVWTRVEVEAWLERILEVA